MWRLEFTVKNPRELRKKCPDNSEQKILRLNYYFHCKNILPGLNYWTTELLDYWTTGLLKYWTTGPLDYWTTGLLDYWTTGLLGHWTTELLDHWTTELSLNCFLSMWGWASFLFSTWYSPILTIRLLAAISWIKHFKYDILVSVI